MLDSVERFKRTLDHLTKVPKLQKEPADILRLQKEPATEIHLARLVPDVELDLFPFIVQTGTQLEAQVPAAVTLTLTCSEKNLRSVVYNLLSNARKYRHPDRPPRVRVACQQEESYHVLEVLNNGLGLELSQGHRKPLGMFQGLHTHVEGTGVGLHMVKRIVENAGSRIEVDSQLDHGSTFRVFLPQ